MNLHMLRPAIAMIELIFAIVVMGIVMMSAPMLISTAAQSGYVAIQQESINEAATQVNVILGYQWDENNTNEAYDPVILSTVNGDVNLAPFGTTNARAGTPFTASRKFVSYGGETGIATAIGTDAGETSESLFDDMDDFNGTSTSLRQVQGGGADYIEQSTVIISRNVSYLPDDTLTGGTYLDPGGDDGIYFSPDFSASSSDTTNIKHIQVTLTTSSTDAELNKTIVLHAFSSNIGSAPLEERP